jgi:hypothetical protein
MTIWFEGTLKEESLRRWRVEGFLQRPTRSELVNLPAAYRDYPSTLPFWTPISQRFKGAFFGILIDFCRGDFLSFQISCVWT